MMTKVVTQKVVLAILLLIVAVMFVIGFLRIGETPILTAESEDGQYTLVIEEARETEFPFGAATCRFVLKRGFRTVAQDVVQIHNDGKTLDESIFQIEWGTKDVSVTVNAEEEEKTIYKLAYDGSYP